MAVYVNTNVSSLNGRRYLNNVQNQLTTTYQRLSSGLRINSAKDDAAGLQISSRLTTQVNGLNQGNRNASDGIALAQTIEGALDETSGMLQKIRTLAVQAANGTNTADDRAALKKEADALFSEINRIATQTTFAGKKVLDGVDGNGKSDTIYGQGAAAGQNKVARMTLQVGANSGDTIDFDVANFKFTKIAEDSGAIGGNGGIAKGDVLDGQNAATGLLFTDITKINNVITLMDKMIGHVDSQRAGLGAIQNRLESSIRNQANVSANQADARSRIRDADFAEESANLSQQSIIQQAATSMLMQANTRPQLGLSLLG
ncbi:MULTISPECIES: flagellin [unclassified Anaerobiospirillum]|uniref:flagellin N-terminal helical domain-containing protein n=1 Tax=unclassified Anaerobiospirillum TaxID=2647410 RepID=UPI001FF41115|nr:MULTISPECIES: flagellin [unclassified Anaerobiospirillum]MCK0535974.1 flagellin [Anaerobiospirillum sp. NML120511]MCK0540359.1 flagellin [Anaerobiospirillum sp. NML02-A-032]